MTPKKYNELNELLAEYSRLSADLAATASRVNKASVKAAEPMLPEYAETMANITDIEAKLQMIAVENPELFPDDKKTHSTPFGAMSFRVSTYLDVKDLEKALLKIKVACNKEFGVAAREHRPPRFTADGLIRTQEAPNIEALERFSDEDLKSLFGIDRIREEKFNVKPREVKMDKFAERQGAAATA